MHDSTSDSSKEKHTKWLFFSWKHLNIHQFEIGKSSTYGSSPFGWQIEAKTNRNLGEIEQQFFAATAICVSSV